MTPAPAEGKLPCMTAAFKTARIALGVHRGSSGAIALPMAGILFDTADIALIILPLMLFHLNQLLVLAVASQRSAIPQQAGWHWAG